MDLLSDGTENTLPSFFQLLTDFLIINTSVKSMVYECVVVGMAYCIGVSLSSVQKFERIWHLGDIDIKQSVYMWTLQICFIM